jgi:hypothetical protein
MSTKKILAYLGKNLKLTMNVVIDIDYVTDPHGIINNDDVINLDYNIGVNQTLQMFWNITNV